MERWNRTRYRHASRGFALCALLALILSGMPAAQSGEIETKGSAAEGPGALATAYQLTPAASWPLKIWGGNDLSCQVKYKSESTYSFFPGGQQLGDCGTALFVQSSNTLYVPDFPSHGGTATGGLASNPKFTPLSPAPSPAGACTISSPRSMVTHVQAGTLRVHQTDEYVCGYDFYTTYIRVENAGLSPETVIIYHAADCYMAGSDFSRGAKTTGMFQSVACAKNANDAPANRKIQWIDTSTMTAGGYEATYGSLWSKINTKTAFPAITASTACQCTTLLDSAAGLSWTRVVQPGSSETVAVIKRFAAAPGPDWTRLDVDYAPASPLSPEGGLQTRVPYATLTRGEPGAPFAGQRVNFHAASGAFACAGTTDGSGVARCEDAAALARILAAGGGIVAAFAGDGVADGSTGVGAPVEASGLPDTPVDPAGAVGEGQACGRPTRLLTVESSVGTTYVEDRGEDGLVFVGGGTWVYLESNGIAGLQRGGVSLTGEEEPCPDEEVAPDTLIF